MQKLYRKIFPFITTYNMVNEYKIHLLYELANKYDEVLYLDFDTIPMTNESFFDAYDLKQGIAIMHNNKEIEEVVKHFLILKEQSDHHLQNILTQWQC